MMENTWKNRVKKRLFKFGRKNRICSYLVLPALFVSMFFFHVLDYIKGNGKRFAMLAMMFCLFTVYSSFSFPLFITSNAGDGMGIFDLELQENVFLANQPELDMAEAVLIEDEDLWGNFSEGSLDHQYIDGAVIDAAGREGQISGTRKEPEDGIKISEAFSKDDWRLILVNKQHFIPDDYTFPKGNIRTLNGLLQCDERILDDYNAMLSAAKEEDIVLKTCSPYRDLAHQQELFDEKMAIYLRQGFSYIESFQLSSRRVTYPGASEHELGLALDIVCDTHQNLDEAFADTEAGKWLAQNSYKYGFILRYPKEKEYITCIKYEPWHFRYVGIEAATVITERGLTLEEFWEELD